MLKFISDFIDECFGFNHQKFEINFFQKYDIPFVYHGYIDEHHIYTYNDLKFEVNELSAIISLNDDVIKTVEMTHHLKADCDWLYQCIKYFL